MGSSREAGGDIEEDHKAFLMINGKKVVATIEARMTSTRLSKKVLLPLAGKPVLAHMIERHKRSTYTDEVVVATTTNATDDPIVLLCEEMQCSYFRGSEEDVLGRIVAAGGKYKADILVQGMADSPMVDWRIVDRLIQELDTGGYDCATNEFESEDAFPVGFDMRVYAFPVLRKSAEVDQDPALREHAGYSVRSQPEKFKLFYWEAEGDMHWPALRLTLDTKEDFQLISAVYDELYPKNPDFSAEDVVAFLKTRPDLVAINTHVVQRDPSKVSY